MYSVAEALGREHFYNSQDNFRDKYYPGLHIPPPENFSDDDTFVLTDPRDAKPRIDEGHRGMLYGDRDYDRGHHRPMQDPFSDRLNHDPEKLHREKLDMELDIQRLKEKQMREKTERDEEKRRNYEVLTQQFPWDQNNKGHGAPRKREPDLFLNTLGGPGGTVVRQNDGYPSLQDPRSQHMQEQFVSSSSPPKMTPKEMEDYSRKLEEANEQKRMAQQQKKINDLRNHIDVMKADTGMDDRNSPSYRPEFNNIPRREPQRSLDLDNSRGGAGAPMRDDRGKPLTRRPITLARNDYGESRIREEIPGKATFDLDFLKEDSRPYHPWGKEGGGAPIRDREGNVKTQIFGKLDGRRTTGSGEVRRQRRRQEVLYNELKQGEKQHKESKQEMERFMKAPQAELADVLLAGRVGKPKRDSITGEIGQQHLRNSDVSKLKMNYQEKTVSEKRQLHEDLTRAAEERKHMRELEKRKEMQESNAHFRHMDSTWGAFGGGAPKHTNIRKKANLTNSLFYPDAAPPPPQEEYIPVTGLGSFEESPRLHALHGLDSPGRFPSSEGSPRYAKTTLPSSHKNMFEGADMGYIRGGDVAPPYATGGVY